MAIAAVPCSQPQFLPGHDRRSRFLLRMASSLQRNLSCKFTAYESWIGDGYRQRSLLKSLVTQTLSPKSSVLHSYSLEERVKIMEEMEMRKVGKAPA